MNNFMKKSIFFLLLLLVCTSVLPTDTYAVKANTITNDLENNLSQTADTNSTGETVSPRSDVIKWRYMTLNGKTYRRLYNYTQDKWIGDWELCP